MGEGGRAKAEDLATEMKTTGKPGKDGRPEGRGPRTVVGQEMDVKRWRVQDVRRVRANEPGKFCRQFSVT